jgi:hypothetical protein
MDYHADRFTDASLLVYEGGSLIAVLPANRDGDVIHSHAGLTFGGFITDSRMTSRKMLRAMETAVQYYRDNGIRRLVYAPVPHIYHDVPAEEDLYALFRSGWTLTRRDLSSAIRLRRRLRASKGRRASVKRAGGSDLECGQSMDWVAFMQLEEALLRERHSTTPTHSAAELARLASRFPDAIKLFVASRSTRLVAGAVIYETPLVAHAQYLGASAEGRELGALDWLVSSLLDEVYADKTYFDFGISTERDGSYLNLGLVRNKESYGARAVAYDRYEIAF